MPQQSRVLLDPPYLVSAPVYRSVMAETLITRQSDLTNDAQGLTLVRSPMKKDPMPLANH